MGLHDLDMGLRFMGCLPATHKSKIRQYKAFNHKIPTGKDQIWSRKNLLFPSQDIRKFEPNTRNQSWQCWLHSRQTQRKEILLAPMEEELILNSTSYWNETDSQSFDFITPAWCPLVERKMIFHPLPGKCGDYSRFPTRANSLVCHEMLSLCCPTAQMRQPGGDSETDEH